MNILPGMIPALATVAGMLGGQPELVLTLEEVLKRVETRYPKVVGARLEREAAAAKTLSKSGAFDPVVRFDADTLRYNSSSTRGKAATTSGADVGVLFPTESGVAVELLAARNTGLVKSPDSSTGRGGTYQIALKIPLLRGNGINPKRTQRDQARLGEPIADQNVLLVRQDALFQAATAYWTWVGAVRKLAIADDLVRVARDRAAGLDREIELKQRAAIDGVEARSQIEQRIANREKAARDVDKAALTLAKFLFSDVDPETVPMPRPEQAPAGFSSERPTEPPTVAEVVALRQRALDTRPELRSLALQRQVIGLDLALARNDLKPQMDLIYAPGRDEGRLGIGDTLKAGVVFTLPTLQRDARGRLDEARAKDAKLGQEEALARRIIDVEIDDAISALRRAYERYGAAENALALTRRVEEGERIRFREGDSTLLIINLRELATAEAAGRLLDIRVEIEQARAALRAAAMQF
jgi:outer membrane protein TolC